ncbi:MAG: SPFH domain-containing protein [Phycisphaerales bacterium]
MKADYLSYRIATGRCILGMVLQGALAATLVVYGIITKDHAAVTASAYTILGVPIWLALAIVFDQHRRERVETLEAEALAQQGGSTSVFDTSAGEFRPAAKRLAAMHRLFLPIVSVVLGLAYLGVGYWRLTSARAFLAAHETPVNPTDAHVTLGWGLAIGLLTGVVGFIFARFISGMAKQAIWSNLRAGAASIVGSAIMGLGIAVGAFADLAGSDSVRHAMPLVVPIAMIVLGFEVFANFLLNFYRPRKAGMMPAPAFDSRILGFVAAPDRIAASISEAINYQLGFDVSSSWFYNLISRSLGALLAMAAILLWAMSAVEIIEPHQRGIVLRFGAFEREVGPGWHWKLPWPMERVEVPVYEQVDREGRRSIVGETTTGVRVLQLGSLPPVDAKKAILWTNEHAQEEVYQIVQPGAADAKAGESGVVAGRDVALVSAEIPLHYVIENVELYDRLGDQQAREAILGAVARRQIVQFFSGQSVDEVLGGNPELLARQLQDRVNAALNEIPNGSGKGAGVRAVFVGVNGVHPPRESADKFEFVVQAEQKREARFEDARKDRIQKLTEVVGSVELADKIVVELKALSRLSDAGAELGAIKEQQFKVQTLLETAGGAAASLVQRARADRWATHMSERGRAARYQGQIAAFQANPELFQVSQYLEALQAAIKDARLYVTDDRVPDLRLNWDVKDVDNGAATFDPERRKAIGEP